MPEGTAFSSRSSVALPFRPVDVAAQARRHRLHEKGAADGAQNRPGRDDPAPALAEHELITEVEAERTRCAADLSSHMRASRDALATLETSMEIAGLRQAADGALARFREAGVRLGSEISSLKRNAVQARAEYDEFRASNRITRAARQPGSRFMAIAVLVACTVIESVGNGLFFAEGSDSGLVGGITTALAISIINVGFGAIFGRLVLPYVNHRNLALKTMGLIALPLAIAFIIGLNGFVAHYRDAYEKVGEAVDLMTVGLGLVDTPFGLIRLQSWLLFFMGTAFAGFAVSKGYHMDDPYPGYGAIDRHRAEAEGDLHDAEQELYDSAADVRDECTRDISSSIERLRGADAQRQQLIAGRARLLADFRAHEDHLEQAYTQLLAEYREANKAKRTDPAPVRFAERFTFASSVLDQADMKLLTTDPAPTHEASQLIDELDRLRSKVFTAYDNILPREETR